MVDELVERKIVSKTSWVRGCLLLIVIFYAFSIYFIVSFFFFLILRASSYVVILYYFMKLFYLMKLKIPFIEVPQSSVIAWKDGLIKQ